MADDQLERVLTAIRDRATILDRSGDWPAEDLADLADVGAMRWVVPREFGGDELDPLELHLRYERLACASLSTALVLTQRDSAVAFIDAGNQTAHHTELLRALTENEMFSTVGIAQLTTSRQGGTPALRATKAGVGGFEIDGVIPWSTGADQAEWIVGGAALGPREQILFTFPRDQSGVKVERPLPLIALSSSHTGSVRCTNVRIEPAWVLKGPGADVLSGRRKGVPIGQAFLALGLCQGALDLIGQHDSARARELKSRLGEQLAALRARVIALCRQENPPAGEGPQLRGACNELAVRLTHATVALYKGSALLLDHPAQRLAREAMFLLVWSCPDPVIDCTMELLADAPVK